MRRILFAITTICLVGVSSAQYRSGGGGDKVYFGGGFGLSIGTNVTSVSASPLVGYRITDPWSVGAQVTYQYVDNKIYDIAYNNYGFGPFTRFQIGDRYFAHAEYEYLNYEYATGFLTPDGDYETKRDGYNSLWLGAGYTERGFFLLALYNVLYDETVQGPYASPFSLRAGFSIGF